MRIKYLIQIGRSLFWVVDQIIGIEMKIREVEEDSD